MKSFILHRFFIIILIINTSLLSSQIKIYDFYTDDLIAGIKEWCGPTGGLELNTYKILKKNPLPVEANYIAVPWHYLYRKKRLENFQPLKELEVAGGFTVCDCLTGNEGRTIIRIAKKIGIDCIFSPCATISQPNRNGISIQPFPYYAYNGVEPSPIKDILYSFVGFCSHPVRHAIFNMHHPPKTVIIRREKFFAGYDPLAKKQMSDEYKKTLGHSRYSLCPRGNEPGSIRFMESLQAGAIPILAADDLKLPAGFDWNTCIIRIAEKDVRNIPKIIQAITPEKERLMRNACLEAYSLYSNENLIRPIRIFFGVEN